VYAHTCSTCTHAHKTRTHSSITTHSAHTLAATTSRNAVRACVRTLHFCRVAACERTCAHLRRAHTHAQVPKSTLHERLTHQQHPHTTETPQMQRARVSFMSSCVVSHVHAQRSSRRSEARALHHAHIAHLQPARSARTHLPCLHILIPQCRILLLRRTRTRARATDVSSATCVVHTTHEIHTHTHTSTPRAHAQSNPEYARVMGIEEEEEEEVRTKRSAYALCTRQRTCPAVSITSSRQAAPSTSTCFR